jgi:uncharacterized protein YxjI
MTRYSALMLRLNNRYNVIPDILGVVTVATKASSKFASLRTTIPMPVVKQWKLKEGDKLDWEWKVQDGEMVLIVRMVRKKKEGK